MSSGRRIIPVFLPNKGCHQRCTYCDQEIMAGEAPSGLDPGQLGPWVRSLGGAARSGGATEGEEAPGLALFGATFTAMELGEQRAWLAAARELLDAGEVSDLRISTRPDVVDEASLELLREYGVGTVELGVQSFDDAVLSRALRPYDGARAEEAIARLKGAGFGVVVQLMCFLPGSTEQGDVESAARAARLTPSAARIFPTLVVRGTALDQEYAGGGYRPAGVEEAAMRAGLMMEPLLRAGVPLLRVGIQDSSRLRQGLLAGPHHPALGEYAWSAVAVRLIMQALGSCVGHSEGLPPPTVVTSASSASLLAGHGGFGLRLLEGLLGAAPKLHVESAQGAQAGPSGGACKGPGVRGGGGAGAGILALGPLRVRAWEGHVALWREKGDATGRGIRGGHSGGAEVGKKPLT